MIIGFLVLILIPLIAIPDLPPTVNMGFKEKMGLGETSAVTQQAREEAPQFERVTWYREPGIRKLVFYSAVLCFSSMGTGYDK